MFIFAGFYENETLVRIMYEDFIKGTKGIKLMQMIQNSYTYIYINVNVNNFNNDDNQNLQMMQR